MYTVKLQTKYLYFYDIYELFRSVKRKLLIFPLSIRQIENILTDQKCIVISPAVGDNILIYNCAANKVLDLNKFCLWVAATIRWKIKWPKYSTLADSRKVANIEQNFYLVVNMSSWFLCFLWMKSKANDLINYSRSYWKITKFGTKILWIYNEPHIWLFHTNFPKHFLLVSFF